MAIRQTVHPFQLLLRKLPKPMRNKYFLSLIVFFALLVFLDKHDMLTQWKLSKSLDRLESDKVYYEEKIKEVKQDQQNVENNKEQFAREKYQMHKADEDVFVIEKNE